MGDKTLLNTAPTPLYCFNYCGVTWKSLDNNADDDDDYNDTVTAATVE